MQNTCNIKIYDVFSLPFIYFDFVKLNPSIHLEISVNPDKLASADTDYYQIFGMLFAAITQSLQMR